jgi:hypothetical protein
MGIIAARRGLLACVLFVVGCVAQDLGGHRGANPLSYLQAIGLGAGAQKFNFEVSTQMRC